MAQEVEEIMKRIQSHRGVKQMMIINKDGLPLKTNMEMTPATEQIIRNIHELSIAARRLVRDVDPTDDLMFLRTRSKNDELLISPDEDFTVVVIQGNGE
ncbi:dynein light chain roadblock-type 1 [Aplysia californica]|uniref:Dynein light chain roadblock n=1 Tax=Aplysia californica TaxID=6500 RepID=A0ABM0K853_APLCA|nr:dynein light chain roadblock-type 1 [Aplysia californica]